MTPWKLTPHMASAIWGGRRLIEEYGMQTPLPNAAEAWVLSARADGGCVVQNGLYAGQTLREIWLRDPQICGSRGARFADFPVLIKFIDAQDDLSVQVHPDDAYCAKTGRGEGKTECWYVLDCAPGAELILGLREKMTQEAFAHAIETDTLPDFVGRRKVQKGDFIFVEAGTLHAICKGVLLAEIQQNSDTTYRIYDYHRRQPDGSFRALHVEDAKAVTLLSEFPYDTNFKSCKDQILDSNGTALLTDNALFRVRALPLDGVWRGAVTTESFLSLLVTAGVGTVKWDGGELPFQAGDSLFVPAGAGEIALTGKAALLLTDI